MAIGYARAPWAEEERRHRIFDATDPLAAMRDIWTPEEETEMLIDAAASAFVEGDFVTFVKAFRLLKQMHNKDAGETQAPGTEGCDDGLPAHME